MQSNVRKIGKVISINIIAIFIIFFLFEMITRLFLNPNIPFEKRLKFNVEYRPSGYVVSFPIPNQIIYEVEDGIIKYDKIQYKLNKYGFRGEDLPLKKDKNELRIFILGGSHVFDLNSFDYEGNYGFPQLIQNYFFDNDYNVRVINAGVPGDDTRTLFTKIILDIHRYEPDIIIINSIWNDTKWISRIDNSTNLLTTEPRAVRKNPMIMEINWLDKTFGFSAFYRKARDYYWRKKLGFGENKIINEGIINNPKTVVNDFKCGLEQYKINIIATVQTIRNINAIPVLAIEERFISSKNNEIDKKKIQYHFVNVNSHAELVKLFNNCDTVIEMISHEYNVPLININKKMEGNTKYFADHVHTTPDGSIFIAKNYYEFLLPLVDQIHKNTARNFTILEGSPQCLSLHNSNP